MTTWADMGDSEFNPLFDCSMEGAIEGECPFFANEQMEPCKQQCDDDFVNGLTVGDLWPDRTIKPGFDVFADCVPVGPDTQENPCINLAGLLMGDEVAALMTGSYRGIEGLAERAERLKCAQYKQCAVRMRLGAGAGEQFAQLGRAMRVVADEMNKESES